MFDMGVETMNLPLEEKMKFEQGDTGRSSGYVHGLVSTETRFTLISIDTRLGVLRQPMRRVTGTMQSS